MLTVGTMLLYTSMSMSDSQVSSLVQLSFSSLLKILKAAQFCHKWAGTRLGRRDRTGAPTEVEEDGEV